jgi:PleD family two-component response regulator
VAKALALMPDFIVLDFDLDGETTTRLKAHISTRGIPVIALAKLDEVRAKGVVSKGSVI